MSTYYTYLCDNSETDDAEKVTVLKKSPKHVEFAIKHARVNLIAYLRATQSNEAYIA